jgi:hypothetical protein
VNHHHHLLVNLLVLRVVHCDPLVGLSEPPPPPKGLPSTTDPGY